MLRRSVILFVLFMLLPLGSKAAATEMTGCIRVTLETKGGEVILSRVGTESSGGYRLRGEYGGGYIPEPDALSPMLALWLAENDTEGTVRILDADGRACFSNLEPGLYLVKHRDALADEVTAPFLVQLPCCGEWEVDATPAKTAPMELPQTGQSPELFFGLAGLLLSSAGLLSCGMACERKKKTGPQ